MKLTLDFTDLQEMVLESDFQISYPLSTDSIKERTTDLNNLLGFGAYHEIFCDSFHIAHGDLRLRNQTRIHFESDSETVEMHFDLSGYTDTSVMGNADLHFKFKPKQHNIVYVPAIKGKLEFGGDCNKILEINMPPAVFRKYTAGIIGFNDFFKRMEKQEPAFIGEHNMPITPAIELVINQLLNCNKVGVYKKLFIESKIIELLLLQLEQFSHHQCQDFCSLKAADVEKIHFAKELILKNIHHPYSLRRLALEIGSNEFTLKKGFKEVFGTTVFGMINNIRMEQAKMALLSGQLQIEQASELAGYKNASHFTTAFKKRYGLTPGRFKNLNNLL